MPLAVFIHSDQTSNGQREGGISKPLPANVSNLQAGN